MSCMDDRSVRFACGVAMSHRCQRTNSREPSGIPTHQREQHAAELRECNAFSTIYEGGASSHPELSLKTRVEARVGENEIHAPGLHSRVDFDERQWYRGEIVSCCGTAVKFFPLRRVAQAETITLRTRQLLRQVVAERWLPLLQRLRATTLR